MPAPAPPASGLGELLRDRRISVGLTTTDVATAMEVHQTTVSGWELGRGWTNLPRHLSTLAGVLGLPETDLWRAYQDSMSKPDPGSPVGSGATLGWLTLTPNVAEAA